MSPLSEIGQGAGLAGASGVRPFLPALLAGALARGDLGIDFGHGPFAFLEGAPFLFVVLALTVAAYALGRRRELAADGQRGASEAAGRDPLAAATLVIAILLGALLFAASLSEGGVEWWPGLVAGALCAALGHAAVAGLLGRARRRVEPSVAGLLDLYAEGFAVALAGLSILFPPLSVLALALFVVLLVRGRRSADRKFEGLRVLR